MNQAAFAASAPSRERESPDSTAQRIRLPLLNQWLEDLPENGRRIVWLDMGQVQATLIECLQGRSGRLLVADSAYGADTGSGGQFSPRELLPRNCWTESVDRVCLWDLIDYLEPESLNALSAELAVHAAAQCRVHALIQYSTASMPERPRRIRLLPDGLLEIDTRPAASRPAPRYSPKRLERLMPEFAVERTMLLNNGMQEFELVRKQNPENSS